MRVVCFSGGVSSESSEAVQVIMTSVDTAARTKRSCTLTPDLPCIGRIFALFLLVLNKSHIIFLPDGYIRSGLRVFKFKVQLQFNLR